MDNDLRLKRALQSLEGLSVGDAFGERFFLNDEIIQTSQELGLLQGPPYDLLNEEAVSHLIATRRVPKAKKWLYTDDTRMALSVVEILREHGHIEQDALADSFSRYFMEQPARGYGASMHRLLPEISWGIPWRAQTKALFSGQGSFGNGAAMRVSPVGAYFADDMDACIENARLSAEVTHGNAEGIAGAIACAVATATAVNLAAEGGKVSPRDFLRLLIHKIPLSEVRDGVLHAMALEEDLPSDEVAEILGSGQLVTAQDTVPYVLWCAANFWFSYEEAMWQTVAGLGDRDTTCAMVGGIVAMSSATAIPTEWLEKREELPDGFGQA